MNQTRLNRLETMKSLPRRSPIPAESKAPLKLLGASLEYSQRGICAPVSTTGLYNPFKRKARAEAVYAIVSS
jgi:hypothetical protein